jgi:hypothetical protein
MRVIALFIVMAAAAACAVPKAPPEAPPPAPPARKPVVAVTLPEGWRENPISPKESERGVERVLHAPCPESFVVISHVRGDLVTALNAAAVRRSWLIAGGHGLSPVIEDGAPSAPLGTGAAGFDIEYLDDWKVVGRGRWVARAYPGDRLFIWDGWWPAEDHKRRSAEFREILLGSSLEWR